MKTCKKNHTKIVYGGKGLCPYCQTLHDFGRIMNQMNRLRLDVSDANVKIAELENMLKTKQEAAEADKVEDKGVVDAQPSEPRDEILCDIHGQPERFKDVDKKMEPMDTLSFVSAENHEPVHCAVCGYFLEKRYQGVRGELIYYICLNSACRIRYRLSRSNP